MLWLICFFNYADRQAIFAIFPKLKEEFGFDKVQLGLIGSAFMWTYAGGALLAGLIVDRFSRRNLILGGCFFWSLVTVTTAWCSRAGHFIAVRALEGVGETFYFPASMSLLSDYHGKGTRSRALSLHQSSVYAGTVLGSWLGALIAEISGWRTGFYLFGASGIILALVLYGFLREPARTTESTLLPEKGEPDRPAQSSKSKFQVLTSPAVILLLLGFLGANFVATIFLTWTPTFLVEKFGFKLSHAGLSGTFFIHASSFAAVSIAGVVADRLATRFLGGRMIVQMIGLTMGAGFVFLVGTARDRTTLILAMTAFGICKGFYDSGIFASLYDLVPPEARGTAAGLMNTVGWGGGALGPLFVGLVSKYGSKPTELENMSQAIAMGGLIYLVSALCIAGALFMASRRKNLEPAVKPVGTAPAAQENSAR
jgi:MFS family permease